MKKRYENLKDIFITDNKNHREILNSMVKEFEEKLGLAARFERLENGLKECQKALSRIVPDEKSKKQLQIAQDMISALLAQEDI